MNLQSALGSGNTPTRHEQRFLQSAAVLLILTAVSKGFSAFGSSSILEKPDPVFWVLKNRELLLLVGFAEILVATLLLSRISLSMKRGGLIWLCANFLLYRAGLWMTGMPATCKCMGELADRLGLSDAQASRIMLGILAYLLGGCLFFMARFRSAAAMDDFPTSPRGGPSHDPQIKAH